MDSHIVVDHIYQEKKSNYESDTDVGGDIFFYDKRNESENDQDVDVELEFKLMYNDWLKTRNGNLNMAIERFSFL